MPKKLSDWLYNIRQWWLEHIWWPIRGKVLNRKIADKTNETRSEAEQQLERIIRETGIRPDAVSATTMRGGPCYLVKHDGVMEVFIHNTYTEAADKAIEWIQLQDDEIKPEQQDGAQLVNRTQRRKLTSRRALKRVEGRERNQGYKKGRKARRTEH